MGKIDIATKQYMSHKNIIADALIFMCTTEYR